MNIKFIEHNTVLSKKLIPIKKTCYLIKKLTPYQKI